MGDIACRVDLWLREVACDIPHTDFRLLYRGQIKSRTVSLEEAGINQDALVYVQLVEPAESQIIDEADQEDQY